MISLKSVHNIFKNAHNFKPEIPLLQIYLVGTMDIHENVAIKTFYIYMYIYFYVCFMYVFMYIYIYVYFLVLAFGFMYIFYVCFMYTRVLSCIPE